MWSLNFVLKSVAIAFAISIAASWMALWPTVPCASGETATRRAFLRSRSALISRFRFIRSARQVQQAPLPGLNTGPTRGKMPEGWTSSHDVCVRQMLPVQLGQSVIEIIVDQPNRNFGTALHHADT